MRIALYQPDIALNLGTNLRTAACLGAEVDIIEPCGFPLDDRRIRRSGMDYIDKVNYYRHDSWQDYCEFVEKNNKRLVLLSSKATLSYTKFKYQKNDILLLGRESAGVPQSVFDYCPEKVTIPMQEGVRSLNVAISCAIVLSEAIRQTI